MSKKSVKKPDYAKFEANRAVKKKNKKKKTTAIVTSVIAACIFIIAAIVAVNVLSPSVTAELTSSAWVPEGAKNASGDEVEMSEVYNTNYSAYQGSMSFSSGFFYFFAGKSGFSAVHMFQNLFRCLLINLFHMISSFFLSIANRNFCIKKETFIAQ